MDECADTFLLRGGPVMQRRERITLLGGGVAGSPIFSGLFCAFLWRH